MRHGLLGEAIDDALDDASTFADDARYGIDHTLDGTLGKLEPRENFVGIRDFKLSFGAKYYEFIGEYILVGNKFKYWIYKELMPMAKKLKMSIVKLLRRKK